MLTEELRPAAALEKHYRVTELMELWGFSHSTVTKMFTEEPDVLRLSSPPNGRRKYVSLSIPDSVVQRVHERHAQKDRERISAGDGFREITLRDPKSERGSKQDYVLKLRVPKKPPQRERVSGPMRQAEVDSAAA